MIVGFATILFVIAVGAGLAHVGVVDDGMIVTLGEVAFFAAMPALLVVTVSRIDLVGAGVNVVASASALAVNLVLYALVARLVWRRPAGEVVIGSLVSGYVNAGNLGIAIAAFVVGDVGVVVPTLLLQLLVVQPIALVVLDRLRGGAAALRRVATNPLTVAAVIGSVIAIAGWPLPEVVEAPLSLLGGAAIPLMLLSYGAALRLSPPVGRSGHTAEVALASGLKLAVMPVVAWAVASALGLEGPALLGVVLTAALPSAQNIFLHATRYRVGQDVARETILVTTVAALPVALVVAAVLG
ncbi:AEC family transporter [Janibacter melonis]|uniref:AEC family transporter n=1 Tax=Janibacter melonis TaxID=262209 RepID=UPI00204349BE|nr:AEC family transporter [Janibacter melonis]MCM3555454.1 AEC family transporter [Janibacter melonis]